MSHAPHANTRRATAIDIIDMFLNDFLKDPRHTTKIRLVYKLKYTNTNITKITIKGRPTQLVNEMPMEIKIHMANFTRGDTEKYHLDLSLANNSEKMMFYVSDKVINQIKKHPNIGEEFKPHVHVLYTTPSAAKTTICEWLKYEDLYGPMFYTPPVAKIGVACTSLAYTSLQGIEYQSGCSCKEGLKREQEEDEEVTFHAGTHTGNKRPKVETYVGNAISQLTGGAGGAHTHSHIVSQGGGAPQIYVNEGLFNFTGNVPTSAQPPRSHPEIFGIQSFFAGSSPIVPMPSIAVAHVSANPKEPIQWKKAEAIQKWNKETPCRSNLYSNLPDGPFTEEEVEKAYKMGTECMQRQVRNTCTNAPQFRGNFCSGKKGGR